MGYTLSLPDPSKATAEHYVIALVIEHGKKALAACDCTPDDFEQAAFAAAFKASESLLSTADQLSAQLVAEYSGINKAFLSTVHTTHKVAGIRTIQRHSQDVASAARHRAFVAALAAALTQCQAEPWTAALDTLHASITPLQHALFDTFEPLTMAQLLHAETDLQEQGEETALADFVPLPLFERLLPLGLERSVTHVLHARTSSYKSTLAVAFAVHAAEQGRPTLVVSLEDSVRTWRQRVLAMIGRLSLSDILRRRILTGGDASKYYAACNRLMDAPLHCIAQRTGHGGDTLWRKIARHAEKHATELIVIDYAQRYRSPGTIYDQMCHVSELAVELGVATGAAILMLSQSNDAGGNEVRGGKKLVDDSATCIELRRCSANAEKASQRYTGDDDSNYVQARVTKNKHGATGGMLLAFEKSTSAVSIERQKWA